MHKYCYQCGAVTVHTFIVKGVKICQTCGHYSPEKRKATTPVNVGRKPKLDAERIEEVEALYRSGYSVAFIAKKNKVSRATIYSALRERNV